MDDAGSIAKEGRQGRLLWVRFFKYLKTQYGATRDGTAKHSTVKVAACGTAARHGTTRYTIVQHNITQHMSLLIDTTPAILQGSRQPPLQRDFYRAAVNPLGCFHFLEKNVSGRR